MYLENFEDLHGKYLVIGKKIKYQMGNSQAELLLVFFLNKNVDICLGFVYSVQMITIIVYFNPRIVFYICST